MYDSLYVMKYQVIILGSGPAGLTAAIYASRANLKTLVIAGVDVGGQLMLTTDVEDFPGFPDGVQGPILMTEMKKQAEKFGAEFVTANASKVDFTGSEKVVYTDESEYRADALIIATGASSMWLGLESEKRLIGHGVSSCAVCDGAFFRNKPIAVIGGGDTAMREALFLAKFGSSVTVIHRRDQLRAFKALQDRAFAEPKIKFVWNSLVEEFVGNDRLEKLRIKNVQTGVLSELDISGAFVAIGHKPNTDFLKGQIDLDEKGYIKLHGSAENETRTNVPGVFAAGDIHDRIYKQAVTAAGAGCRAALDTEEYLESLKA